MTRIGRWALAVLLVAAVPACHADRDFIAPVDTAAFSAAGGALHPDTAVVARFLPASAPGNGKGAQVAGAMIGPEGGSVRLGDFEIVVPPGAVSSRTRFAIRVPPEPALRKHAYAVFSPHNTEFAVPVLLRLPFANTDAEDGAKALWWDPAAAWVELPTALLPDGRIETPVSHFSMYGTQRSGITLAGG